MNADDTAMRVARPTGPVDKLRFTDPYVDWQQREGVRVIRDFAFEDVATLELGRWPRKGGYGVVINIPNDHMPTDAHVVEIEAGGKSEREHHLYEEIVYVVSGRGLAVSGWMKSTSKPLSGMPGACSRSL